jgi:urease accessory protein
MVELQTGSLLQGGAAGEQAHLDELALLRLLQLADSALPVGTSAHSFGLESLIAEELLDLESLEGFLRDYLQEAGLLECVFFVRGLRLVRDASWGALPRAQWLALNAQVSALKMARESRNASALMGRRLLHLVEHWVDDQRLHEAVRAAREAGQEIHYAVAAGLLCGLLGVEERYAAAAFLQQTLASLIFACQRLLPLGQVRAGGLLWSLKPCILDVVQQALCCATDGEPYQFTPALEMGSMRHPFLETRLFVS